MMTKTKMMTKTFLHPFSTQRAAVFLSFLGANKIYFTCKKQLSCLRKYFFLPVKNNFLTCEIIYYLQVTRMTLACDACDTCK